MSSGDYHAAIEEMNLAAKTCDYTKGPAEAYREKFASRQSFAERIDSLTVHDLRDLMSRPVGQAPPKTPPMYLQHWYELVDLLLLHYTDVPRLRRDLIEAQRPDLLQVVDARLAPDPDLDEYPDADGLPED